MNIITIILFISSFNCLKDSIEQNSHANSDIRIFEKSNNDTQEPLTKNVLNYLNNIKESLLNTLEKSKDQEINLNPLTELLKTVDTDPLLDENSKQLIVDELLCYIYTHILKENYEAKIGPIIQILLEKNANIHKIDKETQQTAFIASILMKDGNLSFNTLIANDKETSFNIKEYIVGLIISKVLNYDAYLEILKKNENYTENINYNTYIETSVITLSEFLTLALAISDYHTIDRLIKINEKLKKPIKLELTVTNIIAKKDSIEEIKKKIETIIKYNINTEDYWHRFLLDNYILTDGNSETDLEIVEFIILKTKDDINETSKADLLIEGLRSKKINIVKKILLYTQTETIKNARNLLNSNLLQVLLVANKDDDLEMLQLLFNKGVDINHVDKTDFSVLMTAIAARRYKAAILIANTMDINTFNIKFQGYSTALTIAERALKNIKAENIDEIRDLNEIITIIKENTK
jgi:hypothetical protein